MILGETFLAPNNAKSTEHLWIVITHPDDAGLAVCVNITTKRSLSDTTVVLDVGDHPFLKHPSVVYYADAQLLDLLRIETAISAKPTSFTCVRHKPCSAELILRIQLGAIKSGSTPKKIKLACLASLDWPL